LLVAATLAGCGGGASSSGTTLYAGGDWKVVVDGGHATAFHRVAATWKPDTTGAVSIRILGPIGTVASIPQAAAALAAKSPLIESGMWIDGAELTVKGGGLTPTKGTIYGAPASPLAKGKHLAVAYARTDQHATAVAWSFTVA
jgi:hypothetical protein